MKKRSISLISLLMAILLLAGVFASCGGNQENVTEAETTNTSESSGTEDQGSESESESGTSTEKGTVDESESTTQEETEPPQLDCDNGELIQYANQLANEVDVYFTEGARRSVVAQNDNMSFVYNLANDGNQQVASLKNSKGKSFLQDTLDVFVRATSGETYFASDSSAIAVTNIRRFGFYYYDLRVYGQDFEWVLAHLELSVL